jgi:hypothetical protein
VATAVVVVPAIEARADDAIGVASIVRNDVSGSLPSGEVRINVGESVVHNEIVKTAKDSWTKLVFADSTNLSVGPNATVRLSNFVAAGSSTFGKATIDVAKGAFRFATGHSEKRAYEINTGVATIGVRGTVFEGDSQLGKTRLQVQSGAVHVRTKRGKDCDIRAGQSVVITEQACAFILAFDPGFSSEFTAVQEFAQLPIGQQALLGFEDPAAFILPGVTVTGAVAGGVTAAVTNNSSNGGEGSSQQKQLYYLLLINNVQGTSP